MSVLFVSAQAAQAETRSLKLYHLHTREKEEIVFKRNGRYDAAGLKKINQILRDWRRNEVIKIDPRLLDVVWEAYQQAGATDFIQVVCGYRAPETNSMLRGRSRQSGVAEKSQHMLGKAMDFYIPGVKLKTLREIGLKMQGGGVGYYPTSGSPFVHFDVGNVRHWPKMSRSELVALFPNGKTLHVPSDGKPLPGFEQALASYKSRQSAGQLAIASATGSAGPKKRGLLAALFGSGEDDEAELDDAAGTDTPAPKGKVSVKPQAQPKAPEADVAKDDKNGKSTLPGLEKPSIQIVSPQDATPAEPMRPQEDIPGAQTPETVIAALETRRIPLPLAAPREVDTARANDAVNALIADAADSVPTELSKAPPVELAANAPLPSWRPGETASGAAAPAVLAALASSEATREKAADLVSARPQTPTQAIAAAMLPADAGVSGFAPKSAFAEEKEPVELASFSRREALSALPPRPDNAAEVERALALRAVSNRTALNAARLSDEKPASFSFDDVKTTGKSARPSLRDRKPAARSMQVAALPATARWALEGDKAAQAGSTHSVFTASLRTAPAEVYTAGFQHGMQVADAKRFTGKAVTFMSVAKFETN
ncbi:MAG: DUF882 domain-containing protein [Methylobacterium mesophilicum]|nr:DUF882 domain-containing protein [Methylobacterium mesophilicum]